MLEISWKTYKKELKRIEALEDEKEKDRRYELLDQIMNQINLYHAHCHEYQYQQHRNTLVDRGIVFNGKSAQAMKTLWNKTFAFGISAEEKRRIFFSQYRWHAFSYGLLSGLEGKAAKRAFDAVEKSQVMAFYQHGKEAYVIENAHLLKAKDFRMDEDIYLFDPQGKWTYVRTHEKELGPYFYQLDTIESE